MRDIEMIRQRVNDFSEGYRAGYKDGLEGNAEDCETAWSESKAAAFLAMKLLADIERLPDIICSCRKIPCVCITEEP